MNKLIISSLSTLLLLGCNSNEPSGGSNNNSQEKEDPPKEIELPIKYEEGDFGYWQTEFPDTIKSTELINISNSKNNVFKISYQDKAISGHLFKTYVKLEEKDGKFKSNVTLGSGDLYSTGIQDIILGEVEIEKTDESHIKVNFNGLSPLGDEINIKDHVMYLRKGASAGREATFPELDKPFTTISEMEIEYRGNGEIYASNTFSGCWFTAKVQPSGFTILSTGPADATDYEPWAFDYEILPENTNCKINENQAGMINLYYAPAAFPGYDEISLETVFETQVLFNNGISDMSDRPLGY